MLGAVLLLFGLQATSDVPLSILTSAIFDAATYATVCTVVNRATVSLANYQLSQDWFVSAQAPLGSWGHLPHWAGAKLRVCDDGDEGNYHRSIPGQAFGLALNLSSGESKSAVTR